MMGVQQNQPPLFSYQVNLSERIPSDHILRQISEIVDFSFVREYVRDCYGSKGNVSVDPVVLVKMMLLLFLDDIPSERELMRQVCYRMDYLWFLGYQLDDQVPNHSVLSKARQRWGVPLFRRVFVETLQRCIDAGLVSGEKIHIDSSLINANASRKSIEKEVLLKVVSTEEAKLDEQHAPKSDTDTNQTPKTSKRKPKIRSRTDPEAAVVSVRGQGPARARYKHHRAVDDSKGVITAVSTTPGAVNEGHLFKELVDQHQLNTSMRLKTAVADCQYGTNENYRLCAERSIRAHLGDFRSKHKRSGVIEDVFKLEQFRYDSKHSVWVCPAGKRLSRESYSPTKRRTHYRASLQDCVACVLKPQCTKATKKGRLLTVPDNWQGIRRARAQAHSMSGKKDRIRRKWLGEGSFADAANNHGLKRSRWRGLWRQQIQDLLIAAVQNLRILIRSHLRRNPSIGACIGRKSLSTVQIAYLSVSNPLLSGCHWAQ